MVPSPSLVAHFAFAASSMFDASLFALLERSPSALVIAVLIFLIVSFLLRSRFWPRLVFAFTVTVGVVPSAPTVTSILSFSPRNLIVGCDVFVKLTACVCVSVASASLIENLADMLSIAFELLLILLIMSPSIAFARSALLIP